MRPCLAISFATSTEYFNGLPEEPFGPPRIIVNPAQRSDDIVDSPLLPPRASHPSDRQRFLKLGHAFRNIAAHHEGAPQTTADLPLRHTGGRDPARRESTAVVVDRLLMHASAGPDVSQTGQAPRLTVVFTEFAVDGQRLLVMFRRRPPSARAAFHDPAPMKDVRCRRPVTELLSQCDLGSLTVARLGEPAGGEVRLREHHQRAHFEVPLSEMASRTHSVFEGRDAAFDMTASLEVRTERNRQRTRDPGPTHGCRQLHRRHEGRKFSVEPGQRIGRTALSFQLFLEIPGRRQTPRQPAIGCGFPYVRRDFRLQTLLCIQLQQIVEAISEQAFHTFALNHVGTTKS